VICPGSGTYCNGACVDTTSDPNHCGRCGEECLLLCVASLCV
jgi:hypothetical protein